MRKIILFFALILLTSLSVGESIEFVEPEDVSGQPAGWEWSSQNSNDYTVYWDGQDQNQGNMPTNGQYFTSIVDTGSSSNCVPNGDLQQVSKTFDLSSIDKIRFDAVTRWASRNNMRVLLGGDQVWSTSESYTGEHYNQEIDVSGYGSNTEFIQSYEKSSSCYDHRFHIDNIRFISSNSPPDSPSNPNPTDNENTVSLSPNLEVDVSDPDGDSMDITFYDASDNSVIGTDTGVVSGGTASVQASNFDQTGTTYSWYAEASDGSVTTRGPSSGSWSFTAEHEPEIDEASASPQGGSVVSTNPELSVNVNHPDGRTMDVTFFLNGEAFGADQQVDGSGTASIQTNELDANTIYDWSVVVDDRNGYTVDNQASPWSFETDTGEPSISIDYGNDTNFGPSLAVIDVVPGHSHAGTVDYVRLLDGGGAQIDEVQDVAVDQPVSLLWEGLEQDREYDFRAEIEHAGETAQTPLMSFTTLTVGVNLVDTVANADSYNIYRRTGTGGDPTFDYGNGDYRFIGSGSSLELVDDSSDLEAGNAYCYVATAQNVGGESPGSSEMCSDSVVLNS